MVKHNFGGGRRECMQSGAPFSRIGCWEAKNQDGRKVGSKCCRCCLLLVVGRRLVLSFSFKYRWMPIKTRTVSLLLLLLSLTMHCTYCRRLVCFLSCRYARASGLVYIVDVLFVSFLADTHAKVCRYRANPWMYSRKNARERASIKIMAAEPKTAPKRSIASTREGCWTAAEPKTTSKWSITSTREGRRPPNLRLQCTSKRSEA